MRRGSLLDLLSLGSELSSCDSGCSCTWCGSLAGQICEHSESASWEQHRLVCCSGCAAEAPKHSTRSPIFRLMRCLVVSTRRFFTCLDFKVHNTNTGNFRKLTVKSRHRCWGRLLQLPAWLSRSGSAAAWCWPGSGRCWRLLQPHTRLSTAVLRHHRLLSALFP